MNRDKGREEPETKDLGQREELFLEPKISAVRPNKNKTSVKMRPLQRRPHKGILANKKTTN